MSDPRPSADGLKSDARPADKPGVSTQHSIVRDARSAIVALVAVVGLAGCPTIHQPAGGSMSLKTAPPMPPSASANDPGTLRSLPPLVEATQDAQALERLAKLRDERLRHGPGLDTPVGPGDVIEVSAPQVKELAFVSTRVSGDGIISLPIIGTVRAGGRTEDDLRTEIRNRLGSIMYDPQVTVFVREYRSRKVAVIGAVLKAGLYEPATQTDTIFDMITQARGPSTDASRSVVFIPHAAKDASELGALFVTSKPGGAGNDTLLRNVEPVVFNMRDMSSAMSEVVFSLPVRPGDVIMIPEAGSVYIQGWVDKPGYYKISQDLTMLSVVAAAGGAKFPADMHAARLIRGEANGGKRIFDVDLEAVARGEQTDVYVANGDVIELGATPPRLVAYGLFYFFTAVFHVGAGFSVF
jgi:polysaccharide export outer membrane protein